MFAQGYGQYARKKESKRGGEFECTVICAAKGGERDRAYIALGCGSYARAMFDRV